MARKRRPGTHRQAVGIILLVLGLLLALSFLPKATGLPVVLGQAQRVALGQTAFLIPVYMFLAGAILVVAGSRARFTRRIGAFVLATLTAVAIYHTRAPLGGEIAVGTAGTGSGLVGGAIVWALRRLFGEVGMWLVLTFAVVASGVLWTGASFATVVESAWIVVVAVVLALRRLFSTGLSASVSAFRLRVLPVAVSMGRGLLQLILRHLSRGRRASPEAVEALSAVPGPDETPPPFESSPAPAELPPPVVPPAGSQPTIRRAAKPEPPPAPAFQQEDLRLEVPSGGYQLPPLSLLADLPGTRNKGRADPSEVAKALEQTLLSFGVEAKVVRWEQGPVVTRFEVQPAPGVRVQKISSLTNDIALGLAAPSVRIEAPIPGKSAVGIELPNQKTSLVHIKGILASEEYQRAPALLTVALGKDIAGHPILADLADMPHLLIAGATGSGKSVMLNAIIASLLFRCTPRDLRLLMIDPKRVEFTDYNAIPHLLAPVVTNPRATAAALKEMLREMEDRFERFASSGTRNIQGYNQLPDVEPLPYIVIIVDELADLMMVAPADFEDVICRLAQMTRATGIHLVVATQRPSVDVITGLIKANIPSRIAFAVSSQVDSRTILDMPGAEKLLGKGDMLFMPIGAARPIRAQGSFIADSEIQALVGWWKAQGRPIYDHDLLHPERSDTDGEGEEDTLLAEAARIIVRAGYGSVSLLQRKMKIGYVRAARMIDQLEEKGIVGPAQGSTPREVLVGLEELDRARQG